MISKAQAAKGEKKDTFNFIKTKNFYASKDTIKKMKRQHTWEKIFANHLSHKDLVSRIYKELLQLNNRKINNPIKNWDFNRI